VQSSFVRDVANLDAAVQPGKITVPEVSTPFPEKSETANVPQSKWDSKWIPRLRVPEPTPATEPLNVSVPCLHVRLVLQSMTCSKLETEVPVRLPLYCETNPVSVHRKTNGESLGAQLIAPKSVTV
jgi:hypothetical protein